MEQERTLEEVGAIALSITGYHRYIVGDHVIWARSYNDLRDWAEATRVGATFWTQQYGKSPVDMNSTVFELPLAAMRPTDLVILGVFN